VTDLLAILVGLAIKRLLAGHSWEDLAVWSPQGELLAVVVAGELIRPGSSTYSPAA
jgi:hypothetical protein